MATFQALSTFLRNCVRFRLRTMFIVVAILAIPLAWFSSTLQRAARQRAAVAALAPIPDLVRYEFDKFDGVRRWVPQPEPAIPSLLRDALGRDFFFDVVYIRVGDEWISRDTLGQLRALPRLEGLQLSNTQKVTDQDLAYVSRLKRLKVLRLDATTISDEGVRHLKGLENMEYLVLGDTKITGATLDQLNGMKNLRHLCLSSSPINDQGLQHLTALESIENLQLADTNVTDAGMVQLAKLPRLRLLYLENTQVGDIGLATLEQSKSLHAIYLQGTRVSGKAARDFNRRMPKRAEFDPELLREPE